MLSWKSCRWVVKAAQPLGRFGNELYNVLPCIFSRNRTAAANECARAQINTHSTQQKSYARTSVAVVTAAADTAVVEVAAPGRGWRGGGGLNF